MKTDYNKIIVKNYHKSRKIIESIVLGDADLRIRFNTEIEKIKNEQITVLREDIDAKEPDDIAFFLFWCTPDIIIQAFDKVSRANAL
jgi:hypothetical protein